MLVQALWLLTWPILIIVSYQIIKLALRKYEKKIEGFDNE